MLNYCTVRPFHLLKASAAMEIAMLARPTLTKRSDQDDGQKPVGQARPTEERFLLRVDAQTKRSFSSKEAAATAGAAVKKLIPWCWSRL